jgi:adenine deaminase
MRRERLLEHARGDRPADLLLSNARLVDVLCGEIVETAVAVAGDRIVGLGRYPAAEEIDLAGAYIAPGLIDAHVHVESSLVPPAEFARAVVPRGTTTVVTDPHEIANVLGLEGIRFMLEDARDAPFSMFVMASSCVPATEMETSGARLEAADLAPLLLDERVLGLAEVMSYPGVVHGEPGVLAKLEAFAGRAIDGHCPGLSGKELAAYVAAGIESDHECTALEEAREKLRMGLAIFIREATNARNLEALLPLITPANEGRICWCTDDRQPADLLDEGHIDCMVRKAIAGGLDPVRALTLATWSPARHFRLRDRGALTPGRRADLIVFDDLAAPRPRLVFQDGRLVACDGEMTEAAPERRPRSLPGTMHVAWEAVELAVPAPVGAARARVIGAVPDQLVTEHLVLELPVTDGLAVADPARDLLKMAVIERHRATGNVGLGFVRGLGLGRGALASSVAHDHHNLVAIGADDRSMLTAARHVASLDGGLVVADGETVLAALPLPLAGLMSDRPIAEVRRGLDAALAAARQLGSPLHDPFMAMSFLALEVIPSLKLTDRGLVDVDRFELVPLWL